MASGEWSSVRVRKATLAALRQELELLAQREGCASAAAARGRPRSPVPGYLGLGMDEFILRLLAGYRKELDRQKHYQRRRRARDRAGQGEAP